MLSSMRSTQWWSRWMDHAYISSPLVNRYPRHASSKKHAMHYGVILSIFPPSGITALEQAHIDFHRFHRLCSSGAQGWPGGFPAQISNDEDWAERTRTWNRRNTKICRLYKGLYIKFPPVSLKMTWSFEIPIWQLDGDNGASSLNPT